MFTLHFSAFWFIRDERRAAERSRVSEGETTTEHTGEPQRRTTSEKEKWPKSLRKTESPRTDHFEKNQNSENEKLPKRTRKKNGEEPHFESRNSRRGTKPQNGELHKSSDTNRASGFQEDGTGELESQGEESEAVMEVTDVVSNKNWGKVKTTCCIRDTVALIKTLFIFCRCTHLKVRQLIPGLWVPSCSYCCVDFNTIRTMESEDQNAAVPQ